MNKWIVVAIILAGSLIAFWVIQSRPITVTIEELRTNPGQHNGKHIKTTGIMLSGGFEAGPALSDEVVEREGGRGLKEPSIYLESVIAENQRDCLRSLGNNAIPAVTFCTVDIEGIFEYGGNYGHASFLSEFQIRGI